MYHSLGLSTRWRGRRPQKPQTTANRHKLLLDSPGFIARWVQQSRAMLSARTRLTTRCSDSSFFLPRPAFDGASFAERILPRNYYFENERQRPLRCTQVQNLVVDVLDDCNTLRSAEISCPRSSPQQAVAALALHFASATPLVWALVSPSTRTCVGLRAGNGHRGPVMSGR